MREALQGDCYKPVALIATIDTCMKEYFKKELIRTMKYMLINKSILFIIFCLFFS